MKHALTIILVVLGGLIMSASTIKSSSLTYSITVKVTNIRSKNGRIQLQLYRSSEAFKNETPYKVRLKEKDDMKNGTVTYVFKDLEPGVYGVALLDDENSDNEMNYSMFLPKEGFGFADYYHSAWSKPKFEDFKFTLSSDKTTTAKIRYV